jgi:hypothetical protein
MRKVFPLTGFQGVASVPFLRPSEQFYGVVGEFAVLGERLATAGVYHPGATRLTGIYVFQY